MVFRRKNRGKYSKGARPQGLFVLLLGSLLVLTHSAHAAELPAVPSPTFDQAKIWYAAAKTNYLHDTGNTTSAWKFAEACFEWAEFASNSTQRASLAHEGINAAKFATEMARNEAAGHFFLAMNKGQLARTKSLGALPLVKEMEDSLQRAIKLNARFDHAAADRSLGMLYMDAPGWPTSIGSKSKSRKHLERAVELVPDYPTNYLTLMEAYLRWEDADALQTAMAKYRRLIPAARGKYSGAKWQQSWKDWDLRWKLILQKSQEL
jgi:hypothetical protein